MMGNGGGYDWLLFMRRAQISTATDCPGGYLLTPVDSSVW